MKDYSDILKDVESGKYIKEVPPDGTPAHEISQSLKEISVSVQYLEELRRISESAENQAKSAKEDSKSARIRANISNLIAFGSFVVAVIALIQNLIG